MQHFHDTITKYSETLPMFPNLRQDLNPITDSRVAERYDRKCNDYYY
jgi:hypothetical protein